MIAGTTSLITIIYVTVWSSSLLLISPLLSRLHLYTDSSSWRVIKTDTYISIRRTHTRCVSRSLWSKHEHSKYWKESELTLKIFQKWLRKNSGREVKSNNNNSDSNRTDKVVVIWNDVAETNEKWLQWVHYRREFSVLCTDFTSHSAITQMRAYAFARRKCEKNRLNSYMKESTQHSHQIDLCHWPHRWAVYRLQFYTIAVLSRSNVYTRFPPHCFPFWLTAVLHDLLRYCRPPENGENVHGPSIAYILLCHVSGVFESYLICRGQKSKREENKTEQRPLTHTIQYAVA